MIQSKARFASGVLLVLLSAAVMAGCGSASASDTSGGDTSKPVLTLKGGSK